MILTHSIVSILTGLFFLYYGMSCLFSASMKAEFERFGVTKLRVLIGALEIAGGLGALAGPLFPRVGVAATAGIALLMMLVVVQRLAQRDTLLQMAQAMIFALISGWLATYGVINL
jgi:hypothetical protein